MAKQRPDKPTSTFKDRLTTFAKRARDKADKLAPGVERDDLLRRAGRADTASHLDEWANSPGLRPPK